MRQLPLFFALQCLWSGKIEADAAGRAVGEGCPARGGPRASRERPAAGGTLQKPKKKAAHSIGEQAACCIYTVAAGAGSSSPAAKAAISSSSSNILRLWFWKAVKSMSVTLSFFTAATTLYS